VLHAATGHDLPYCPRAQSINPRLLLAVFLPVLLFGSAFTMDWHTVRRQKWAILLLAAPGVALGTILTAVLVKYTFPYDWTWTESLLVSGMTGGPRWQTMALADG